MSHQTDVRYPAKSVFDGDKARRPWCRPDRSLGTLQITQIRHHVQLLLQHRHRLMRPTVGWPWPRGFWSAVEHRVWWQRANGEIRWPGVGCILTRSVTTCERARAPSTNLLGTCGFGRTLAGSSRWNIPSIRQRLRYRRAMAAASMCWGRLLHRAMCVSRDAVGDDRSISMRRQGCCWPSWLLSQTPCSHTPPVWMPVHSPHGPRSLTWGMARMLAHEGRWLPSRTRSCQPGKLTAAEFEIMKTHTTLAPRRPM